MHGKILKIVYIQRIYIKIIAMSCNFHYFHNTHNNKEENLLLVFMVYFPKFDISVHACLC